MMLFRSHALHRRPHPRHARTGSVIVLVVAVLALLAVIGTIYIVSARAQRSTAVASNVAANLNFALDAVNQRIIDRVGADVYDVQGVIGGYASKPNPNSSAFGTYVSRRWDIPELGVGNNQFTTGVPRQFGTADSTSNANGVFRDESWLASGIYHQAGGPNVNGIIADTRYNDFSILTPGAFNPATGAYDPQNLGFFTGTSAVQYDNIPLFSVVPNPSTNTVSMRAANYAVVLAGGDAFINLLPFSEASGIRYRYGVRIVDTSSMANLNVGLSYGKDMTAITPQALNGTYMTGYDLTILSPGRNNIPFADGVSGNPYAIQATNSPFSRMGQWNPTVGTIPSEFLWQSAVMRFDSSTQGGVNALIAPYDPAEELELRSYGSTGTNIFPRSANAWPTTMGTGSWDRNYYTAYSYSRELRPYSDFPFQNKTLDLSGANPSFIAPTPAANTPYRITGGTLSAIPLATTLAVTPFPSCIPANPDTSTYNIACTVPVASDEITNAATNIATAMRTFGFSDTEVRAFAVNYLTYRWNSWTSTGGATPAFTLPEGPSILDNQGLCIRNALPGPFLNADYTSPNLTSSANQVYVGYAAQPFINEVVITVTPPTSAGAVEATSDTAVELYNPYPVAMSLEGFALRSYAGTTMNINYDFTGKNLSIPANGYFVVALQGSQLLSGAGTLPANAKSIADSASFKLAQTDTAIYLMRKYLPRGKSQTAITSGTWWAAVDQCNIGTAAGLVPDAYAHAAAPDGPPVSEFDARRNADTNTIPLPVHNVWMAAIETKDSEVPQTGTGSLGLPNPTTTTNYIDNAPRLYDRFMDHIVNDPVPVARRVLDNIADFNRIMRITNQVDATTGLPANQGTIPTQLVTIVANAPSDAYYGKMRFPIDAELHFDFAGVASLYSNMSNASIVPGLPSGYTGPPVPGDTRAVALLDCLAFTDRVSDFNIDVGDNGGNPAGLGKIRLPGRINVNTASPEVLAMLPGFYNMPTVARGPLIGAILAYRWRTNGVDPRIPAWAQPTSTTIIDFTKYPGYGIHSLAELNAALDDAMTGNTFMSGLGFTPTTLDQRDALWASIYNYLTVRSDTFVLYGYLEAVKQNPRYTGPFDNSTVWYGNNLGGNITDDPSDAGITNIPLLRVARRRWVAILDRSQANFNISDPRSKLMFPQPPVRPRIIAQRDLPQ